MHKELIKRYPASTNCTCNMCKSFCIRSGWWSVQQARIAIRNGYAHRMMMEISPEFTFAVLSPAFLCNENMIALQKYSGNGCCFLHNGLCELHDIESLPLECAFCNHDRIEEGQQCHGDLEKDWNTSRGQALTMRWCDKLNYSYGLKLARYFMENRNGINIKTFRLQKSITQE